MDNPNTPNMMVLTEKIESLRETALACGNTKGEILGAFLAAIVQMTDVSTGEKREQALHSIMAGLRFLMEHLDQINQRTAN